MSDPSGWYAEATQRCMTDGGPGTLVDMIRYSINPLLWAKNFNDQYHGWVLDDWEYLFLDTGATENCVDQIMNHKLDIGTFQRLFVLDLPFADKSMEIAKLFLGATAKNLFGSSGNSEGSCLFFVALIIRLALGNESIIPNDGLTGLKDARTKTCFIKYYGRAPGFWLVFPAGVTRHAVIVLNDTMGIGSNNYFYLTGQAIGPYQIPPGGGGFAEKVY